MDFKDGLAEGFKSCRKATGMTQEDFGTVSSRTYIRMIERRIKSPTLEKLDQLAREMNIHPIALMLSIYMKIEETTQDQIMSKVDSDISTILNSKQI